MLVACWCHRLVTLFPNTGNTIEFKCCSFCGMILGNLGCEWYELRICGLELLALLACDCKHVSYLKFFLMLIDLKC